MGVEWQKPTYKNDALEGLILAQSESGFPTTELRPDTAWSRYVQESCPETWKEQFVQEVGWSFSGGQSVPLFSVKALELQIKEYGKSAPTPRNMNALFGAALILQEMVQREIGPCHEYSISEAFFGSNDGLMAPIPLDTGTGFGLSKLSPDKIGLIEDLGLLDYFLWLVEQDYERLGDEDKVLWVWATKGALKDQKLPIEKLAALKSRLFTGANAITSINGRRVFGNFVGKYMKRSAEGGFMGVVSYVLARGGWHKQMEEVTHSFEREDEICDIDIKKWDKCYTRLVLFFVITICCSVYQGISRLRVWRHYERVIWSPLFIGIIGILIYCGIAFPSGDIATVVINSMGQKLVFAYTYCCLVPEKHWTYNDFRSAIILRVLGDDSVSTISNPFKTVLKKSWIQTVIDGFAEFGWTAEMPRDPPELSSLKGDMQFAGHMNMWAEVPTVVGLKRYCLPILPFSVVLSINEWKKLPKNREVPDAVRDLARYYASVERAFPYLWSQYPIEREYMKIAWHFLQRHIDFCRKSLNPVVRKAAEGVPGITQLVQLYFPPEVNVYDITREVHNLLV